MRWCQRSAGAVAMQAPLDHPTIVMATPAFPGKQQQTMNTLLDAAATTQAYPVALLLPAPWLRCTWGPKCYLHREGCCSSPFSSWGDAQDLAVRQKRGWGAGNRSEGSQPRVIRRIASGNDVPGKRSVVFAGEKCREIGFVGYFRLSSGRAATQESSHGLNMGGLALPYTSPTRGRRKGSQKIP